MHMFLARGGERKLKQELDDNEDIEIHLMSIEEIKQLLSENKIYQSMHATALFYALQRLNAL
jgi:ADP-ribose pyrophosphatase